MYNIKPNMSQITDLERLTYDAKRIIAWYNHVINQIIARLNERGN